MIDTHAHLDFPEFEKDREEVISRFFESGPAHIASQNEAGRGKAIINIGVDLERSRKSIEIAEKHENVYASVGLHPDFFSKGDSGNQGNWGVNILKLSFRVDELRKLAKHKKVVAVGETGLDYYQRSTNKDQRTKDFEKIKENQKNGFINQINLAKELGLPVIVHCREAWNDLREIISEFSQSSAFSSRQRSCRDSSKPSFIKFVLHCYSGEKNDTKKFLKLPNVCFSFSGNITYPKPADRAQILAEAVRMIPLDKIMLDSDAPFLAPQDMRGKRNEPIFVKYIAKKIAEIKRISEDEVERKTDENAERFFGLG